MVIVTISHQCDPYDVCHVVCRKERAVSSVRRVSRLTAESRGQRAEGRGQREEGRGQRADCLKRGGTLHHAAFLNPRFAADTFFIS